MEHQDGVRKATLTTQMITSKSIWEPSIQSALLQHKESPQDHIWQATNCPFLLMVRPGVSIRRMEKTRYSGKLFPKRFRSALTWGLVVGTCIRGKLLYVYAKCAWCTACAHETLIGSFKWCSKNSLQDHCSRWTLLILAILFLVCDTPNQTIFFFSCILWLLLLKFHERNCTYVFRILKQMKMWTALCNIHWLVTKKRDMYDSSQPVFPRILVWGLKYISCHERDAAALRM